MQFYLYTTRDDKPMLFRDLDNAQVYAEADCSVIEEENAFWALDTDEPGRHLLHTSERFTPITVIKEISPTD